MFKKIVLATLATMAFSVVAFAAPKAMNKVEATNRLNTEFGAEVKTIEKFKEDFEAVKGDMSKMPMAQKKEFNRAISVISSKVGISTAALQRVFLRKSDILADMIRLEDTLQKGTAEQKDAAKTQIELTERVGKALTKENYASTEAAAGTRLLQLDLTTLPPKATETVKGVNESLRQGKTLVEAIKENTKGINLEDLINCKQG